MSLSVVIPSFNSGLWLQATLDALAVSVGNSEWSVEVIVVDDGSTDGTTDLLSDIQSRYSFPFRIIRQDNGGRFIARWTGVNAARYERVLLLDSRVLLHKESLAHVWRSSGNMEDNSPWNAHVVTDPAAPLVGRFWDVPVAVFWGSYLRKPRPMLITTDNFDRVPKGTTAFIVPRALYIQAARAEWPEGDPKLSSDDTKLIRYIAGVAPVRLDPGFKVIYRPRVDASGFLRHTRDRGSLFVDSYAGTSGLRNLILGLLAIAPVVLIVGLIAFLVAGLPGIAAGLLVIAVLVALIPLPIALINGVKPRGAAAYLLYLVPFAGAFWLGLLRGAFVHRRHFRVPCDPATARK